MRLLGFTLFLVVLAASFTVAPALYAQGLDPNDNFDDGVIDTSKWQAWAWEDRGCTIGESGGKMVMSLPVTPDGEWVAADATTSWLIRGPFDVQVDYELQQWPAENGAMIGLMTRTTQDDVEYRRTATRASGHPETGEAYLASAVDSDCRCLGIVPTADTTGKLRLIRGADSVVTMSYWSAATSEWIAIGSEPLPVNETTLVLYCWGSGAAPVTVAFDNFQVNAGEVVQVAPIIEEVEIDRGPSTNLWGEPGYHQRVAVRLSATSLGGVACVIVNDPGGGQYVMSTCKGGGWPDWSSPTSGDQEYWCHQDADYTVNCGFYEGSRSVPPEAGAYRIQVNYWGSSDRVVYWTPEAPAVAEGEPSLTLVSPGIDAVTDQTEPLLEWAGAPYEDVQVRVHPDGPVVRPTGDDQGLSWSASLTGDTSVTYNFDGSGAPLEPGHGYLWEVESRQFEGNLAAFPRVSLWTSQVARRRLAVYAPYPLALPELPGTLGFVEWFWGDRDAGHTAVRAYRPDPWAQDWFTAEGPRGCADFSWDGTKLLYQRRSHQLWVRDYTTGLPPVQVPGVDARYEASWSPDGARIAYGCTAEGAMGVWIVNEDGTDPVLLVPSEADDVRYSRWSPDGVWISYWLCCDAGEAHVRLTRADGSESRELLTSITGVTGYPGYSATWVEEPAWSPDARQLALVFVASSEDGSDTFTAIGVMPREGGEITPIFFNPPGYVCCAGPDVSCWSPDGTSIVFSSGYHLPVDPEWENAKGEPGVEMWMMPADGSSAPVRLTYNSSYDHYATWWAPNTPVGTEISVVKGDASVTFAQVTAEGSTRLNVTDGAPGAAPEGYAFVSDLWSGATTAGYQGDITVTLPYDASVDGQERALVLMQWNPARAKWQNITARPTDVANHVIRGRTRSLSTFVACVRTR